MIYLDNNATTPIDPRVLEAMLPTFTTQFGNPASKTHSLGWFADEMVQIAREQVAAAINASPEEIIFTSGATEANNLALSGVVAALKKTSSANIHLISLPTEHRSVLDPLQHWASNKVEVTFLPVKRDGLLDESTFSAALRPTTKLVSAMLANNEIGVVQDISTLAAIARGKGVLVHCDATQALGKISVDVQNLGVDLLSLSAHKIHGPKGAGALFVRESLQASLSPQILGGGHENGLRSGTLNVHGIVGMGKACAILGQEWQTDAQRMKTNTEFFFDELQKRIPGIRLNGSSDQRIPGNLNIILPGVDNSLLIGKLATKIALSTTSACSSGNKKGSHVLQALSLSAEEVHSSVRIGIGKFNTAEELGNAVNILEEAWRACR